MLRTAALVASLTLALAGTALAGNGKGSSSLTVVMVSAASPTSSASGPSYGDTITFSVSSSVTQQPYVSLACYQNGNPVFGQSAGFFAGYAWPSQQNFTLSSQYWTGGAADCTATLYYYNGKQLKTLATLDVPVSA